ncbi:hypothetical protein TRFO_40540 [Tritrichomonas foetus]|uniref:IQ calmodulin-binding motif family protein n=1 Tax=Tritrichomonas foetus TaxID=1144522 RepID=A0A1J4J0F8_9EUKA|nr:hypothetical protein TRFO_40540 [Tritrichomonas foetus]|eukprot:OHS93134.1 hypothetical protein TRFO_40540 [Tritrichomonas foetus]
MINHDSNALVSTTFLGTKPKKKPRVITGSKNDPISKQATGIAKEKTKLLEIIKNYAEENEKLSLELELMENAMMSQADRERIFQEFEADYHILNDRLESRKAKLVEIDQLVSSFRCIEEKEEYEKMSNKTSQSVEFDPLMFSDQKIRNASSTKRKTRNSYFSLISTNVKYPQLEKYSVVPPPQSLHITAIPPKPVVRSVQKPQLIPSSKVMKKFRESVATRPKTSIHRPLDVSRQPLVEEHERLIAISLHLERQMLVQKMFLRLWHDHRDLTALRVSLNALEGGGESVEEESVIADRFKIKINNLRNKINREKDRLKYLSKKPNKQERAAISIQSLIRGYLVRRRTRSS